MPALQSATKQAQEQYSISARGVYESLFHSRVDASALYELCKNAAMGKVSKSLKVKNPEMSEAKVIATASDLAKLRSDVCRIIGDAGKEGGYPKAEIEKVKRDYLDILDAAAGMHAIYKPYDIINGKLKPQDIGLVKGVPASNPALYETAVRMAFSNFLLANGLGDGVNYGKDKIIGLTEGQHSELIREIDVAIAAQFMDAAYPGGFIQKMKNGLKGDINSINQIALDSVKNSYHALFYEARD